MICYNTLYFHIMLNCCFNLWDLWHHTRCNKATHCDYNNAIQYLNQSGLHAFQTPNPRWLTLFSCLHGYQYTGAECGPKLITSPLRISVRKNVKTVSVHVVCVCVWMKKVNGNNVLIWWVTTQKHLHICSESLWRGKNNA